MSAKERILAEIAAFSNDEINQLVIWLKEQGYTF